MKLGLSPSYVLDDIEMYEIQSLLKYQYLKDKENWEQARMVAYVTAKANGVKNIKINDIIKFTWEQKAKEKPKFLTDEELERFRNKAKWMIENNVFEN